MIEDKSFMYLLIYDIVIDMFTEMQMINSKTIDFFFFLLFFCLFFFFFFFIIFPF
jgi:ABC-type amino acid transport system permease subunit